MLIRSIIGRAIRNTSCFTRTDFVQETILQRSIKKKIKSSIVPGMRNYASYEGDGRTVGFVINKKGSKVLMLDSVGMEGFVLSDGRELVGSIMIFPHTLMSWNVLTPEDVTEESLTLLKVLEPQIDILIFGYGASQQFTKEIRTKFTEICRKLKIKFEALPTHQAAGLYNFLADERRLVAGALIPPNVIDKLKFDRTKHLYLNAGLEDEENEETPAIESGKPEQNLLK